MHTTGTDTSPSVGYHCQYITSPGTITGESRQATIGQVTANLAIPVWLQAMVRGPRVTALWPRVF